MEELRTTSQVNRELTKEEVEKLLLQNNRMVSNFQSIESEEKAKRNWDVFYKRNETKFFKDRHWTTREFKELLKEETQGMENLLEVGCGVGNLIFPLLEDGTNMHVYACDFSQRAIEFVKNHALYNKNTLTVFQTDITTSDIFQTVPVNSIDIVTMVFVLSAIHPDKFTTCLKNINSVMKPGGILLFRDYGVNDMTQIRFKSGNKISENFYLRQDGTRTFFFELEKLREVFLEADFIEKECYYVHSRTVNIKDGINVPRVFLQGKFLKKTE